MAKITERRVETNLRNSKFRKLLEEAKSMVQQGKYGDAAYSVLEHMNLEKDENNQVLFDHIPDRQLAELLGIPNPNGGGKTTVWKERQRLIQERWGTEKIDTIRKVDISEMEYIGSGAEFVYVIYLPLYRKHAESQGKTTWECKVGSTTNDIGVRISQMTFPEKPKIALIIRTDDCKTLEYKIHDKLKKQGKHIPDALGKEWFMISPDEIKRIVKPVDEKFKKEESEKLEKAKQLLNVLGINDPSETQLDTILEMLHSTKNSNE